jgi:hypothetical protein
MRSLTNRRSLKVHYPSRTLFTSLQTILGGKTLVLTARRTSAAQHPEKVAALQQRLDDLAKQSEKPLFLVDQFKVVTKGMHGEPVLPSDEEYAGVETP